MKHGKKYNDSRKAVDSAKQYASDEALSLGFMDSYGVS